MNWLGYSISSMRARRFVRSSTYRAALDSLPDWLEEAWRHGAPQEYPGIRTDAFFFVRAAEGLMRFFDAARQNTGPCALPSEAADSVWHAWLRRDAIGLERFCRRHFGQVVPHVERAELGAGALANTLVSGRRLEGIFPLGPGLPQLFGLDARLRMPGGHGYWNRDGDVVYARLGRRGRRLGPARVHPELEDGALLAAGLVDGGMVLSRLRARRTSRAQAQAGGDGVFDGGPALAFTGDGGCTDGGGGAGGSDSGCDAGSSCGSSCGGGGD